MSKSIGIGIAVMVILAAGIGIYASNSAKNDAAMIERQKMEREAMQKGDAMAEKEEGVAMGTSSEEAMMKAGSYEPYASAKVAMASADSDVVLFFRARWCPVCRAVDADIRAHLKEITAGLTILDVDYDNSTDLKKKYGVTYQHTFVQVDAQGNLIRKWSGSPTLAAIVAEVN